MRLLNARHALRKKYTDVLTFRQDPLPLPPRAACAPYLDPRTGRLEHDPRLVPHIAAHAGDIFLAVPFCARLAVPRALRTHEYLLLATIHGLAHLAGHVHNTAPAARRMKAAEERAVAALCEAFALATCRAEAAAENVPFIPTSYLP